MLCIWLPKTKEKGKPEVIAKAAVMIIIYQKTVYMDISLVSYFLLWFLC